MCESYRLYLDTYVLKMGNMQGQRVGYIRVSTLDQQAGRQLVGVELDRTFTDHASGKDTKRPQLEQMLSFVRSGDTVIVHSMDRLARNLDDLRRIVQILTGKGVRIEFVKEHLTFTGEDSPMASLMLSVMGAFAEFERSLIKERQREGIALAKKRGVYRGRKKALSPQQVAELNQRVAAGISKAQGARRKGYRDQSPNALSVSAREQRVVSLSFGNGKDAYTPHLFIEGIPGSGSTHLPTPFLRCFTKTQSPSITTMKTRWGFPITIYTR